MTEIPVHDRSATADQVVAALDSAGLAIMRELAAAATMDRLKADFEPYLDRVQAGRADFAGHRTNRISNLIAKTAACQELATQPLIMAACDRPLRIAEA